MLSHVSLPGRTCLCFSFIHQSIHPFFSSDQCLDPGKGVQVIRSSLRDTTSFSISGFAHVLPEPPSIRGPGAWVVISSTCRCPVRSQTTCPGRASPHVFRKHTDTRCMRSLTHSGLIYIVGEQYVKSLSFDVLLNGSFDYAVSVSLVSVVSVERNL